MEVELQSRPNFRHFTESLKRSKLTVCGLQVLLYSHSFVQHSKLQSYDAFDFLILVVSFFKILILKTNKTLHIFYVELSATFSKLILHSQQQCRDEYTLKYSEHLFISSTIKDSIVPQKLTGMYND